jgi:hypothetical protein
MISLKSCLYFKTINLYSDGSCGIDIFLEKTIIFNKIVFNEKDLKFEQKYNFIKTTLKSSKVSTLKNINYRKKLLK